MKFKKISLIIFIIVCLFAVASVSASEADDINVGNLSSNEITMDEVKTDDDILEQSSDNGEVLGDAGTFDALQQKINAGYGSTITLENNYAHEGSEYGGGITIDRPITIDGKGHTIDANGRARIFYVLSDNVTLKNITFINAKFAGNGGAILWNEGDNGNVSDCRFVNNTADDGGAIYWYHSGNGAVSGCSFLNNTANYGAAIKWVFCENGAVSSCSFVNNTANNAGGAINWNDCESGNISGCSFVNNAAPYGGAIYEYSSANVVVSGCSFVNNTADEGGAIELISDSNNIAVSNCSFVNNSAKSGGAIGWFSGHDCVVSGCSFVNNNGSRGGAINWHGINNGRVSDCSFINNTINNEGAAIYWYRCANILVSGCSFVNNTANGSSILYFSNQEWGRNLTVNNNIFLNNNDDYEICFLKSDELSNVDFNWFSNNATNPETAPKMANVTAGAWLFLSATAPDIIQLSEKPDVTFKLYAYNRTSGSVVEYDNTLLIPLNLTLTSTNGKTDAETVKLGDSVEFAPTASGISTVTAAVEGVSYTATLKVTDGTTFWDLNKAINGNTNKSISLDKNYTYNPDFDSAFIGGIVIDRPVTIDGNGYTIDAKEQARIFHITSNSVTIKNITFANGVSYNYNDGGGAIRWDGGADGVVSDCSFVNNYARYFGGAIYWGNSADGVVSNCSFVDNTARYYGGAIYWVGRINWLNSANGVVCDCSFVNNSADYGGAIHWVNAPNGTVSSCSFVDNSASNSGGAIHWDAMNGVVSGCSFANNTARYYGGAIYAYSAGDNCSVCDCSFVNNSANYGGAIRWIYCDDGNLSNCSFVNNSAIYKGGAVYWDNSHDGSISDCSFVNNTVEDHGAAIHWEYSKDGVISRCSFVNNTAKSGESTIYFYNQDRGRNLTVSNNVFLNNNNEYEIYFLESDELSNVDFNWFSNNATNPEVAPKLNHVAADVWLFLNATAQPDVIAIEGKSDITFKLYAYNRTSGEISEYDNTLLIPLNLTLTSANGKTNVETVKPGDVAEYAASSFGTGSVTATIENATYTIEFTVKYDPKLAVESLEIPYSENINLTLDYNATSTGKVNITLKGKKYNMTFADVDLNKTVTLANVLPDEYNITVAYSGDDSFINATANATLTVSKLDTNITCASITTTYNSNDGLVITLTDINGKPIAGVTLAVDLNGIGNFTTDGNGTVKVPVKGLDTGNYTAVITFNETEKYFASNATANVTILKASVSMSSDGLTTIYKVHKYLNVALKDADGNPITVDYVNITINGVTYNCPLDENGNAELIIRLNARTYTATMTFENGNYNKTTITAQVTVKKAANPLKVKGKTVKVKFSKLKKKAQKLKVTKVVRFTKKGVGALTYKKVKGNKKIKVNKKTGKITIKKGLKKGTYKVKMKIKAKGNRNYKASSYKTVTFKIKVK